MLIEMPEQGFPVALGRHLRGPGADLREQCDRANRAAAKGKAPASRPWCRKARAGGREGAAQALTDRQ